MAELARDEPPSTRAETVRRLALSAQRFGALEKRGSKSLVAEHPEGRGASDRSASALRGLVRPFVLLMLAARPTHGYELRQRLEDLGLSVEAGGVYRLLHRLESAGHLSMVLAAADGAGPDKRICSLTDSGFEELRWEAQALGHVADLVGSFSLYYEQIAASRGPAQLAESVPAPALEGETASAPPVPSNGKQESSRTPIEEVGLAPRALERLRHASLSTIEEIAVLAEWELARLGLWVGDIRQIIAALDKVGLSLRNGNRGGPPRHPAGREHLEPVELPVPEPEGHTRERDEAIVRARLGGDTLEEIAQAFDLSRERVRQILVGTEGADSARSQKARAERNLADAQRQLEKVLAAWREGAGAHAIARSTRVPVAYVKELVEAHVTPADRAARRVALLAVSRAAGKRGHPDRDLIAAIRKVAETIGEVPSGKRYREAAVGTGLPSISTIENRFGGWNAALRAAGFTTVHARRRDYQSRWTEEACLDAVRGLVAELGELPSQRTYVQISEGRADLPCVATLRKRVGGWSQIELRLERERVAGDGAEEKR